MLVNIEQLDHVQELPTVWTCASCHINIDAHDSDQLEAVYIFPRGQTTVSDTSFKVLVKYSGSGHSSFAANLSRFSELGQLPGTIQLERLNEGCGIEAAVVTNNDLYHQACTLQYNNTKLQRAEKRTFTTEGEINDAPGVC